jgi:hypothetical protein
METFERQLQKEFEMQKSLFLGRMSELLRHMSALEKRKRLTEEAQKRKREIEQLVEFVKENPNRRSDIYKQTHHVVDLVMDDIKQGKFDLVLSGDEENPVAALLDFCQALRPFRSLEAYAGVIIEGELFPQIESSFQESDSDVQRREIDFVKNTILYFKKNKNDASRIQLLYWLRHAFQQSGQYLWVDERIKQRFCSMLPDKSSQDY